MTMPAAPPPELVESLYNALLHSDWQSPYGPARSDEYDSLAEIQAADRETNRLNFESVRDLAAAVWPDVLAAVAAHEQQLRQTIANEIERERQRPALMTVRREALDDAYASAYRILRTFDATFGSPDRTGAP